MSEEEKVRAATQRFYDALELMITGHGTKAMRDAWHHTALVSGAHPTGDWAYGWDEVLATWEAFATIGNPQHAGTRVRDIHVHLYGDVAYTTSVFTAAPSFGGAKMNCTNVLHRVDGVWKVVHHHADRTPSIDHKLDQLANEA